MAKKFYAVKAGRNTGIYTSWPECEQQVKGYSGATYKSFSTRDAAQAYLQDRESDYPVLSEHVEDTKRIETSDVYAFVDGSFNSSTNVYGYGGFLRIGEEEYVLQGSGSDEEMAAMRNVAGEVMGSLAAIEKAFKLGLKELYIYYDYMGIEEWANGRWKANKPGTIAYKNAVAEYRSRGLTIRFIKVAAHTGIPGNERADRLAKEAVGLE